MPTFLLSIFRNPYAIGVLAVLLVGGIQQARVWSAQSDADSARTELAEQRQRWTEAEAEGQKAAREALQAALQREREEAATRVLAERNAAQRAREAARDAQAETDAWQRRYNLAVKTNPSCAAWSLEVVACPVR